MKVVTTDGHEYVIHKTDTEGLVSIEGSEKALEVLDDTVTIAGLSDDDSIYVKSPGTRYMHEGSCAMWVQWEILNYL